MPKSLSQRIAERMSKKSTSAGGQNRAAFLALKPDIEEALKDRWPVKSIWETLHAEGKIRFSYQAFRNYVNALITDNKQPGAAAPTPFATTAAEQQAGELKIESPTPTAAERVRVAPAPPPHRQTGAPGSGAPGSSEGFVHNPNPNQEDYL